MISHLPREIRLGAMSSLLCASPLGGSVTLGVTGRLPSADRTEST